MIIDRNTLSITIGFFSLLGIIFLGWLSPDLYNRIWCVINEIPSVLLTYLAWHFYKNQNILFTFMLCGITGFCFVQFIDAIFRTYIYINQYENTISNVRDYIDTTYSELLGFNILVSGVISLLLFFVIITKHYENTDR